MTDETKDNLAKLKEEVKIELVLPKDLLGQLNDLEEDADNLKKTLKRIIHEERVPSEQEQLDILLRIRNLNWFKFYQ